VASHDSGFDPGQAGALSQESTEALLQRLKSGDQRAQAVLVQRYLPQLRAWAHGRLPRSARDLFNTEDLVQDTFLRALMRLKSFVPETDGSFLAYLRQTLLNRIRDLIRKAGRTPGKEVLQDVYADRNPSPVEAAIGKETLESYDKAMATLSGQDQEAIMLRIEMGFSNEAIAQHLGCPSPNAARMTVARALVRLADAMGVSDGRAGR